MKKKLKIKSAISKHIFVNMRRNMLAITSVLCAVLFVSAGYLTGSSQEKENDRASHYFWNHEDERVFLRLNTRYAFLSVREPQMPVDIAQRGNVITTGFQSDGSDRNQFRGKSAVHRYWAELSFEKDLTEQQYLDLLADIRRRNSDVIIAPFFKMECADKIGLSNFFYVKLKNERDLPLLERMAEQKGSIIIYQDRFMPLWFTLSVTEASELNALEAANFFHESGLFEAGEPDLMANLLNSTGNVLCTNDEYFYRQWALRNTVNQNAGTSVDIKACAAWQLSTGANIVVAVIDQGFDPNNIHPDLEANLLTDLSFDAVMGSPQRFRGNHGVPSMGIIGAIKNNTIGVAGVAPNAQIMSISHSLREIPNTRRELATGINWAVDNGADVINNSWSGNELQGRYIQDAINHATQNGRLQSDGRRLGTVVVHSSGNQGASSVNFPGNLANVITVGAIYRESNRISISNFGDGLNVVAPGWDIRTTNAQGGYSDFRYTSVAAPHVAAIAALILSVRPDLYWWQVRNAIESTATKITGTGIPYVYSFNPQRPNGTWNQYVGHGLVNAYRAVKAAVLESATPFISGPSVFCQSGMFTLQNGLVARWNVSWGFSVSPYSNPTSVLAENHPFPTTAGLSVRTALGTHIGKTITNDCTSVCDCPPCGCQCDWNPCLFCGGVGCDWCLGFRAFPNPATDELTIEFQNLRHLSRQRTAISVRLLDANGNLHRQTQFEHSRGTRSTQPIRFNISNLSESTYFLHVEANGHIQKKQIVVSRN